MSVASIRNYRKLVQQSNKLKYFHLLKVGYHIIGIECDLYQVELSFNRLIAKSFATAVNNGGTAIKKKPYSKVVVLFFSKFCYLGNSYSRLIDRAEHIWVVILHYYQIYKNIFNYKTPFMDARKELTSLFPITLTQYY